MAYLRLSRLDIENTLRNKADFITDALRAAGFDVDKPMKVENDCLSMHITWTQDEPKRDKNIT